GRHAQVTGAVRSRAQSAAYLLPAEEARRLKATDVEDLSRDRSLNLFVLLRWREFLTRTAERRDPLWAPWQALATLSPKAFKSQAAALAGRYARPLAAAHWPMPHADPRQEALRRVLRGPEAPADVPLANFVEIRAASDQGTMEDMNLSLTALWSRHADAGGPPRAMAVEDAPALRPSYVFLRGN